MVSLLQYQLLKTCKEDNLRKLKGGLNVDPSKDVVSLSCDLTLSTTRDEKIVKLEVPYIAMKLIFRLLLQIVSQ